jgi:hypothetical protein
MSTTPNYNWPLIENTDFVTNLPADLETLADAIDASFAADEGDLLVGGTSNIFEPLPIGAAGTVLTSDGDTAEWAVPATPPSPTDNWTLLNTGGTALAGSSTVTVSGISGQNQLLIIFNNLACTTAAQFIRIRLNSASTNYVNTGYDIRFPTSYSKDSLSDGNATSTSAIRIAKLSSNTNSEVNGYLYVSGANATGVKPFHGLGGVNQGSGNDGAAISTGGIWNDSATISSVTIYTESGNFANGGFGNATLFVYGSA